MTLNCDQLAQFRGCEPENSCYHDCCEAAQQDLDEGTLRKDELRMAAEWASKETWV